MSLTQLLKAHADQSAAKLPEAVKQLMSNAIDALSQSQLMSKTLKVGDQFPDFSLPNDKGVLIDSKALLKEGPLVVAFYRGGWCPYCNIELRALQEALSKFIAKGAQLVGISPESPDNSLSTVEKNNLEFEVLTDENNKLAKLVKLVYELPQDLIDLYGKFGISLQQSQGNSNNELPISATYVIDTSGTIIYDFIEADYKLRADPKVIIEVL